MATAPFNETQHAMQAQALVELLASPSALALYQAHGMKATV